MGAQLCEAISLIENWEVYDLMGAGKSFEDYKGAVKKSHKRNFDCLLV